MREWIASVLTGHYRLFYGIALGYLKNASMAEDAVQTAAVKGLQNLKHVKQPDAFLGWFAKITRNTCLDMLRHKSWTSEDPLEVALEKASSSARLTQLDRRIDLLSEISALPEKQAIVVQLRFLEDRDIDEIAEQLKLKRNTVEVRLHRALAKLAKSASLQALRRIEKP